jgi:ribose 5-phosphate isomerase B
METVALGCDHAGREFKALFTEHLNKKGYNLLDCGIGFEVTRANYPVVAELVAQAVLEKKCQFGILICGTGIGMAMVANRFKGVRAANCNCEIMARLCRAHNDANVLTLGQRVIGPDLAISIVDIFLSTSFESGGRHSERLKLFN